MLIDEDRLIAEATGNPQVAYTAMVLAAWRGQEPQASELIEVTAQEAAAHGMGRVVNYASHARSVLYNGLGRYEAARDTAWQAFERGAVGYGPLVVPELAEAAARAGDLTLVRTALDWLSERSRATPNEWARGIEARVRALLSDGEGADSRYRESIELLTQTPVRTQLARAHLLYGEWLRRERRRAEARDQLRTAHEMLDVMGIGAFAERARRELLATGETARKRTVETAIELTAQEAQVARLARDGLSNPRDRRAAVHQHPHRPVPPGQGLHQARHKLSSTARGGAAQRARRCRCRAATAVSDLLSYPAAAKTSWTALQLTSLRWVPVWIRAGACLRWPSAAGKLSRLEPARRCVLRSYTINCSSVILIASRSLNTSRRGEASMDREPPSGRPTPGPDPGSSGWPLCGVTPDWVDEAEWARMCAARGEEAEPPGLDEEFYADPDHGPPGEWAELPAEAAAARAGAAAEEAVLRARLIAAGLDGDAHRRGDPPRPGIPAGPAAGFGQGCPLDGVAPGTVLSGLADEASGEDRAFAGVTGDQLLGLIGARQRLAGRQQWELLMAVAEFIRRRPDPGCGPADLPGAMPLVWNEHAAGELAVQLHLTAGAAAGLLGLAHDLTVKLPLTGAALRDGVIDLDKARIIALHCFALSPAEASAAEKMVLGLDTAGEMTWGMIRDRIARAVIEVNPAAARQRREEAAKDTRVEMHPELSGNCQLAGRELPPAAALAATENLTARAVELRAAGVPGGMDALRALAYLEALGVLDPLDHVPGVPGGGVPGDGTRGDGTGTDGTGGGDGNGTTAGPADPGPAGAAPGIRGRGPAPLAAAGRPARSRRGSRRG